jgi:hypothetical protein
MNIIIDEAAVGFIKKYSKDKSITLLIKPVGGG